MFSEEKVEVTFTIWAIRRLIVWYPTLILGVYWHRIVNLCICAVLNNTKVVLIATHKQRGIYGSIWLAKQRLLWFVESHVDRVGKARVKKLLIHALVWIFGAEIVRRSIFPVTFLDWTLWHFRRSNYFGSKGRLGCQLGVYVIIKCLLLIILQSCFETVIHEKMQFRGLLILPQYFGTLTFLHFYQFYY